MTVVLNVEGLNVSFRQDGRVIPAVRGVSFTVSKGETVALVGESGSGKSVTALSTVGLLSDNAVIEGSVTYQGRQMIGAAERDLRAVRGNDISFIFQEPMTSLNPLFTCGDQVAEAIMLHQNKTKAEARQMTVELFKKVQLPRPEKILDSYPHQISGGQKQRVMIAMAMSCNPGILIADEPTTALDVTVQATILDLMRDLRDEIETSIIFITHDLGVIAEIADRVIVMYKGDIVEQGPIKEIFSNPQHPYTKGLLACRPPLEKRYSELPTIANFMGKDENGKLIELQSNIEEVIAKVTISEEVHAKRLENLKKQEPLLQVKNLCTWFPASKNFFGTKNSTIHWSLA